MHASSVLDVGDDGERSCVVCPYLQFEVRCGLDLVFEFWFLPLHALNISRYIDLVSCLILNNQIICSVI